MPISVQRVLGFETATQDDVMRALGVPMDPGVGEQVQGRQGAGRRGRHGDG